MVNNKKDNVDISGEYRSYYKILDAILQQARIHPKGLNSLPKKVQEHIAKLVKK